MDISYNSSVQDEFLSNLISQKIFTVIYTINGFQIRGIILDHDECTILVEADGKRQMVYKSAISTIAPFEKNL